MSGGREQGMDALLLPVEGTQVHTLIQLAICVTPCLGLLWLLVRREERSR